MINLLTKKGITKETIEKFKIRVFPNVAYFPIFNIEDPSEILYEKYRYKTGGAMMPKGGKTALYGTISASERVLITEGDTDMLSAQSIGINSITSTTGVMSFQEEWIPLFEKKEVYICFDNDIAGHNGMARMYKFFPKAKFIFLNKDDGVKNKGDLADFISNNDKKTVIDKILSAKEITEPFTSHLGVEFSLVEKKSEIKNYRQPFSADLTTQQRIDRAKEIPFDTLFAFNKQGKAICPFHNDTHESLSWKKDWNTVKCFTCQSKAMDTIGFTMALNKINFYEALDKLVEPEITKINNTTFIKKK